MVTNLGKLGVLLICVAFAGLSTAGADVISPTQAGGVYNAGLVQLGNTIAGGANNGEWRTIYEFSTATLPPAANIDKVYLNGSQVAAGGFLPVYLHHIAGDGTVTTADYGSATLISYGAVIPLGTTNGPFSVDVTDAILDDLNNSRSYSGFRLLAPGYPDGLYRVLSNVSLEVSEVPEPATLSLVAVGAVVALRRRRRKS